MAVVNNFEVKNIITKHPGVSLNMPKFITHWAYKHSKKELNIFSKKLFDTAKDLFRKDLTAHYGCVNAIEFSNDGNLLFSGGDDRRVLMWDVNKALMYYTGVGEKPAAMRAMHQSNIFCLAVDDDHRRILSGSNDDQVILHDYTRGDAIDCYKHECPVFSLSVNPSNGNVFVTAADNGKILVYDIRDVNDPKFCLANLKTPFHGVMFNPAEPSLVATANSKLGVHIWDMRQPNKYLVEFCKSQSMSVRWNQSGTILLALRNLLPLILYDPLYPEKYVEFDSDCYYNACTMKSCSFAGDFDEYVVSGSDDFNLYMWKVPNPWPASKWVGSAQLSLSGHRSIVNQVRYSPRKQILVTSGVEKKIKLWSPLRLPFSEGDRDHKSTERSRLLCSASACINGPRFLAHDYSQESVDEDRRMIHFFDSLLRHELEDPAVALRSRERKPYPPTRRAERYQRLILCKRYRLSHVLRTREDHMCSLTHELHVPPPPVYLSYSSDSDHSHHHIAMPDTPPRPYSPPYTSPSRLYSIDSSPSSVDTVPTVRSPELQVSDASEHSLEAAASPSSVVAERGGYKAPSTSPHAGGSVSLPHLTEPVASQQASTSSSSNSEQDTPVVFKKAGNKNRCYRSGNSKVALASSSDSSDSNDGSSSEAVESNGDLEEQSSAAENETENVNDQTTDSTD